MVRAGSDHGDQHIGEINQVFGISVYTMDGPAFHQVKETAIGIVSVC